MAESSGIRSVENLQVNTDIGKCEIHLCVGDITALKKQDKVDVLVISAFPGDYTPTRRSLVGQLLKLGVNVRQLARDKEEDLRELYSCWWSKPLPNHLSFERLLCFEGSFRRGRKMGEVVGDIFRCLVPVLANKEGMVIMPLLATGDQGYSKSKMLKLLVEAAIEWMKAGLPLRCLKIVLFSRDISTISKTDEPLIKLFENLREKERKKQEKKPTQKKVDVSATEFDVYLSYSEEDTRCIADIIDGLKKNKSDLRIFSSIQELDREESWQEKLYATITKCRRVMALITPTYLQSSRCTEQYNIALCHSRKIHQSVLVPLYVSEVPYMPTYMQLTQYIDCRINYMEKINVACVTVISCLTVTTAQPQNQHEAIAKPSQDNYDVFLSYSHCNEEVAHEILKGLQTRHENINIFIDTAELKAGGAWQQTLYHALDNSKIVIALISNDYVHSKVCQEELNLAIALNRQGQCKVIPLIIESVQENFDWLNDLCPIVCSTNATEEEGTSISTACETIIRELNDVSCRPNASDSTTTPLPALLEEVRSLLFQREYRFKSLLIASNTDAHGHTVPVSAVVPVKQNTSTDVDIYIISCKEDIDYCQLLIRSIHAQDPSLVIRTTSDGTNSDRLSFLDNARLIISMLSEHFANYSELIHELNVTWCRQRRSPNLCFLVITIDQLPARPTYLHLFPSFFNCEDKKWQEKEALEIIPANELTEVIFSKSHCQLKVVLCLLAAAKHISQWLQGHDNFVHGLHDKFSNPLLFGMCIQRIKEERSSMGNDEQSSGALVEAENNVATSKKPCENVVVASMDEISVNNNDEEKVATDREAFHTNSHQDVSPGMPDENGIPSIDEGNTNKNVEDEKESEKGQLQGNSCGDSITDTPRENDVVSIGLASKNTTEESSEKTVANENNGKQTQLTDSHEDSMAQKACSVLPREDEHASSTPVVHPETGNNSGKSSSTCLLI